MCAPLWLAANPGGHLVLLAGNGHCHDSAIINRMKRRGVTDAISVRDMAQRFDSLGIGWHGRDLYLNGMYWHTQIEYGGRPDWQERVFLGEIEARQLIGRLPTGL